MADTDINALPQKCFSKIMSKFPLQERIQLRIVCKHWQAGIEEMCRKMESLKLFDSITDALTYCVMLATYGLIEGNVCADDFSLNAIGHDDELFGKDSSTSTCHFLVSLFPNVKKLTIGFSDPAKIDAPFLLSKWTLEYFTLRHNYLPKCLLTAINAHKSLKALNLFNDALQEGSEHLSFPKVQLPILNQLEQFSFGKYGSNLVHPLSQLGPNLKHLICGEIMTTSSLWKQLFVIKPEFARSLTHLTISHTDDEIGKPNEKDLLEFVCTHLTSLTFLNITDLSFMPLELIITQLARLPNLNSVWFYPNKGLQNIDQTINQVKQLPKLNSVKILQIAQDNLFTIEHFNCIFPPIFPNVEELVMNAPNSLNAKKMKVNAQKQFPCLQKFTFYSAHRSERSLAFTGRHAEAYDKFLYDKRLNWENPPFIPNLDIDPLMRDCITS